MRVFRLLSLVIAAVVCLACEPQVPDYIQADVKWMPVSQKWISAPLPDSHRLEHYMYAQIENQVRIPNAQRRVAPPERRAIPRAKQRPAIKGPPGTVKVLALRGKKPVDVIIWVNGIKAGAAPMYINLPSGTHRFDVHTLAGEKLSRQVEIKPRSTHHEVFRFELPE